MAMLVVAGSDDGIHLSGPHGVGVAPLQHVEAAAPLENDEAKLAYAWPHRNAGASGAGREELPDTDAAFDGVPGGAAAAAEHVPEAPLPELDAALAAVLAGERRQLPPVHLTLMAVMLLATLLTSVLSKMSEPCGGAAAWAWQAAVVPPLLAIWAYARWWVLHKRALKAAAGMDAGGEVQWGRRNTVVFPAICILAGLVAGMFGLGGAVVQTPLMLELGVHPQVTAATTQTMLLLTAGSAATVYAIHGDIAWGYAGVLAGIALLSTLAGQLAVDRIIRRVGRPSVLVIVLVAFFIVACALSYYIAATGIVDAVKAPAFMWTLGSMCPK